MMRTWRTVRYLLNADGALSVERGLLDDAARHVGERVDDDEGGRVVLFDDALDAAYLKARDDAEEYVLLGVSPAAPALVDGHAAAEVAYDGAAYLLASLGDYDDGRVLFDAVE